MVTLPLRQQKSAPPPWWEVRSFSAHLTRYRLLDGAAGQLQIRRNGADTGPAGISGIGTILQIHVDRLCPVGQLHVGVDASKVAHGLVSSL